MYTVSFIAILGILCMYACYRPLCACYKDFYTGNKNGRSVVVEERDKHAGFMLFLVIFAVALLTRFIAAVMYKGYETDMNCFISWSDMVVFLSFINQRVLQIILQDICIFYM